MFQPKYQLDHSLIFQVFLPALLLLKATQHININSKILNRSLKIRIVLLR